MEHGKNHNLVFLYEALLDAGIFEDDNGAVLVFLLLSQDFDKAVKILESNGQLLVR